jgi:hypothetical protein
MPSELLAGHRNTTKLLAMNYRAAQTPEEVALAFQALIAHVDSVIYALEERHKIDAHRAKSDPAL